MFLHFIEVRDLKENPADYSYDLLSQVKLYSCRENRNGLHRQIGIVVCTNLFRYFFRFSINFLFTV